MLTSMRVGTIDQLLEEHYMTYCEQAFTDFCDWYWPCSFHKYNVRCVNVSFGHGKGHQNAAGKLLATGYYVPSFDEYDDLYNWTKELDLELRKIQMAKNDLTSRYNNESNTCTEHIENMKTSYKLVGSAGDFRNHHTCFCCLRDIPVHPLTCGHVLCSACVHSYGEPRGRRSIEMLNCPICQAYNLESSSPIINFMPPLAGARVLSLDG